MLKLNSVFIFSDKPKVLSEFYEAVLAVKPGWSEGDYVGFEIGGMMLMVGKHSEVSGVNKEPQRIMFNLETPDVQAEFDRIKDLQAKVIAEPYHPDEAQDMTIATFADPDGNYFQLTSPSKM